MWLCGAAGKEWGEHGNGISIYRLCLNTRLIQDKNEWISELERISD